MRHSVGTDTQDSPSNVSTTYAKACTLRLIGMKVAGDPRFEHRASVERILSDVLIEQAFNE
jgi:hypothetical protein